MPGQGQAALLWHPMMSRDEGLVQEPGFSWDREVCSDRKKTSLGLGTPGMWLRPEVEPSQEVEVTFGVFLPHMGARREGKRSGQRDQPV